MLGGLLPDIFSPEAPEPAAEYLVVDQEAAYPGNWTRLAGWCWERNMYLACRLHDRRYLNHADEELIR